MSDFSGTIKNPAGSDKGFLVRKFNKKVAEPYLFVAPGMILLVVLMLVPIIKVVQYSFFEDTFISATPLFVGIQNYLKVFNHPRFVQVIQNSVVFTAISIVLHLVIGLALAEMVNQPINRFVLTFFRLLFILPWIFTAAVVALAWQLILTPLGVVNYILKILSLTAVPIEWLGDTRIVMFALIMINAWRGYPFYMVSILSGLQSIPEELYEAAYVDGANKVQGFFYITIPQLKPILLSVGLLDAIWTLNLFPLIWLTTGGGPNGATETIATFTYKLAFNEFQFGQASAMAVIAVIATMFITMFYLRYQKIT